MKLTDGLYEELLTESLAEHLVKLPALLCKVPKDELAERLGDAIGRELGELLDDLICDSPDLAKQQLFFVNELLKSMRKSMGGRHNPNDTFVDPPQILRAIYTDGIEPELPETGLRTPYLFTAGKGSPSLLSELRREITECDQVNILVSFITLSGVRKLFDLLKRATAIGADNKPPLKMRILTTTYTGATDQAALDLLASLPGCEVKVSLDGRRTRLHAKAWIFERTTSFGTAYVGSANLSGAALLGGLEWTVKFTEKGQENLYARARAHFETLWNEEEFQAYDPNNNQHRNALARALKRERGNDEAEIEPLATITFFDLEPKDYQRGMLDQLRAEREHGRRRNLVVAATGTGKTVVAAFDYRASCEQIGGHPRLLFVAHRTEILRQSMRTFREVLRDNAFGELLAGGVEPRSYEHLFATIDSVNSRKLIEKLGAEYWHTIIIDECHRMAAIQFDLFANAIRPNILLGLTATPERADGKPIFNYFDNRPDGSPAVELRLWQALDLQLLAPFEYYACDDETDFSHVQWDRPCEREDLDKIVTGNELRADLVIREWKRMTSDPRNCRALVFCVSIAHAEFMAQRFNAVGLTAQCVFGHTDPAERLNAPQKLKAGQVCALVTCDLFNEGIDLPSVDTLLLLRPTQSPVLFQQQIGRGLRLSKGKESCLVLDFVGRHRTEFRFDRIFSAITGLTRRELISSVEHGFSGLPPGCHIHLQRQTRDQVLHNLRTALNQSWRRLRTELETYIVLKGRADVSLADFLRDQGLDISELYRKTGVSGWTALKRDVRLLKAPLGPEEGYFGRRYESLLQTEDPEQLNLMARIAEPNTDYQKLAPRDKLRLQMLAYQIDGARQVGSGESFLRRLNESHEMLLELAQLVVVLQAKSTARFRQIPGIEDLPLGLHIQYKTREILTAVGYLTAVQRLPINAGVFTLKDRRLELLLVTLDKSDGFHDRIAYHDYAISADLFHWQSQNRAGPTTMVGRRYLESPANGWQFQLFVRTRKGLPYYACGPVTFLRSEGARPISIVWRLHVPLPARLFQEFSVLRGA